MQKTEPTFQASLDSMAGPCLNIPPPPQKSLAGYKLQQVHSKSQGGFTVVKGGGLSWHSQGSSKTWVRVQAHPSPTWCNTRGLQDSRATSLGTSLLLAAMCTRPIWLHGRLPCSCPARPLHPASTPPTPTLPDLPTRPKHPGASPRRQSLGSLPRGCHLVASC